MRHLVWSRPLSLALEHGHSNPITAVEFNLCLLIGRFGRFGHQRLRQRFRLDIVGIGVKDTIRIGQSIGCLLRRDDVAVEPDPVFNLIAGLLAQILHAPHDLAGPPLEPQRIGDLQL